MRKLNLKMQKLNLKMGKLNLKMGKLNLPGTYWRGLAAQCAQKKALTIVLHLNLPSRQDKKIPPLNESKQNDNVLVVIPDQYIQP